VQILAPLVSEERVLLEVIGVTKQEFLSPLSGHYWQARQLFREVVPLIRLHVMASGILSAECFGTLSRSYYYRSRNYTNSFVIGNDQYANICVELSETSEWTICTIPLLVRGGSEETKKYCGSTIIAVVGESLLALDGKRRTKVSTVSKLRFVTGRANSSRRTVRYERTRLVES
jgi:hypothetical protein